MNFNKNEINESKIIDENQEKNNTKLPSFAKDIKSENIKDFKEANKEVVILETRNIVNDGEKHPETGVVFKKKEIEYDDKVHVGTFPEFESEHTVQLDEDLYNSTDNVQFRKCTLDLKESIEENPGLAEQFTDRQLEQIDAGRVKIDGLTWHHSEEPGVMELVDSSEHRKTGHTGGQVIWGGGFENR